MSKELDTITAQDDRITVVLNGKSYLPYNDKHLSLEEKWVAR